MNTSMMGWLTAAIWASLIASQDGHWLIRTIASGVAALSFIIAWSERDRGANP